MEINLFIEIFQISYFIAQPPIQSNAHPAEGSNKPPMGAQTIITADFKRNFSVIDIILTIFQIDNTYPFKITTFTIRSLSQTRIYQIQLDRIIDCAVNQGFREELIQHCGDGYKRKCFKKVDG
eukprot:TRINITY_DN28235_c1_g1_i1.p4 TRINITY_DN28235_c1_g1~~TRINITY_DN28235_c1_g1_i1.p4  ORF type:complete len:123 (-),score=2.83 TRINITY_DN28235_c1_g1_i1:371-739(-)